MKRSSPTTLLALLCVVAMSSGCPRNKQPASDTSSPQQDLETATVILHAGGRHLRVRVEVVRSDPDRQRGLMFRKKLAHDAGMLFIFDRQEDQSFWMKNTYLPLDMIFIDKDMKVVGIIHNTEPLTTTSRTIGKPSIYTLEVNAGYCKKNGVAAGTRVEFEGVKGLKR